MVNKVGKSCTAQEDLLIYNDSSTIVLDVARFTTNGTGLAKASYVLRVS